MEPARYPLAGVRVVEFGQYISGPCAAVLLAEMGADVAKIEPPEGDPFRHWEGKGLNGTFVAFNRGKRSTVVDLKSHSARKDLAELIDDADVLIENYRPGVMKRLGLAYDDLRESNPRLIYCSITGFGSSGPYAQLPAYDSVGLGYSGLAGLLLDLDEPRLRGPALADAITGHSAAFAILADLRLRDQTGVGQHLEVSMLGATSHFLHSAVAKLVVEGREEGPYSRVRASQAYAFRTRDGEGLLIHLSSPTKFWQALCAALERPDLAQDARFAERSDRVANYELLSGELAAVFKTKRRREWLEALQRHGVPCAPVNGIEEVLADPQLRHLGIFTVDDDPDAGRMPEIRPPVHFDGNVLPAIPRAPHLGEHTAEVLGAFASRRALRGSAWAQRRPTGQ